MKYLSLPFFLFCCLSSILTSAQSTFTGYAIHLQSGTQTNFKDEANAAFGLEMALLKENNVYSLAYNFHVEIIFPSDRNFPEEVHETSIFLGKYHDINFFRIRYGTGLSANWGVLRGREITLDQSSNSNGNPLFSAPNFYYEKAPFFVIGLPMQVAFHAFLSDHFSIGLHFHANLNNEKSYFMPRLSIAFGKQRKKN